MKLELLKVTNHEGENYYRIVRDGFTMKTFYAGPHAGWDQAANDKLLAEAIAGSKAYYDRLVKNGGKDEEIEVLNSAEI